MRPAAVVLVLVLQLGPEASSQDDPRRLINRQEREGIDLSPLWRGVVVDWTFQDPHEPVNSYIPPREKVFQVIHMDHVEDAKERVEEIAGTHGRLEIIEGTPCFISYNDLISNLSAPVTLNVDRVSTWQALRSVIRQVNGQRRYGTETVVWSSTAGAITVPEAFDRDTSITLHLNNVTAREAICRILAVAPISVGLWSRNARRVVEKGDERAEVEYWQVEINFYRGNHPIVGLHPHSRDRGRYWRAELAEAALPADSEDNHARRLRRLLEDETVDRSPGWRGVLVDWPAVDVAGTQYVPVPPDKEFHMVNIDAPERAVARAERLAKHYGRLEMLHGTPCFIPWNETQSNLSLPVTLDLSEVSTWAALKEVIQQVNCNRRYGEETEVMVYTLDGYFIPAAFDGAQVVSLRADNITAREAICKILHMAPLSIGIQSTNRPAFAHRTRSTPRWHVAITFYEGNQQVIAPEAYTPGTVDFWTREIESAQLTAPGCRQ
jgi:hypothetical protein